MVDVESSIYFEHFGDGIYRSGRFGLDCVYWNEKAGV